jgi:hypothetical protein
MINGKLLGEQQTAIEYESLSGRLETFRSDSGCYRVSRRQKQGTCV